MGWFACRRGFPSPIRGNTWAIDLLARRVHLCRGLQRVSVQGDTVGPVRNHSHGWHVDGGNPFHGRAVLGKSIAAMSWGPVIRLCSRSSHTMRAAGKQPHKGLSHTPPARLCVVRARKVAAVHPVGPVGLATSSSSDQFPVRLGSHQATATVGACDGGEKET